MAAQRLERIRARVHIGLLGIFAIFWAADRVALQIILANAKDIAIVDASGLAQITIRRIIRGQSGLLLVEARLELARKAHRVALRWLRIPLDAPETVVISILVPCNHITIASGTG